MKKNLYTFTKDYLDCLAYAGVYATQQSHEIISINDLFAGVVAYSKSMKHAKIMRAFFGIKDLDALTAMIKDTMGVFQKPEHGQQVKLTIGAGLNAHYATLKEQGIDKLNFLALLSNVANHTDTLLDEYLAQQGVDKALLVRKVNKVLTIVNKVSITPAEFFGTVDKMLSRLGLNLEHMDMMIEMGTLTGDDLNIEAMIMGSGDTDVLDDDSEPVQSDAPKSKGDKDKKLTIEYFATDLTAESNQGLLDPVIGRKKEIDQIIYTLMRKTKNNPLLIGEAGVGKTAVVEGLAHRITTNDVPKKLQNKRLMMLDVGSLVAGTKYRGEFEARLKAIIEESVDPTNNIILFVDEAHTLIGAGNAEGSADAANMLKPLLARGKLQMIGATTFDEYQKHIEKDPALKRRFQELHVDEPTEAVAIEIMQGLKERFEDYHGVTITDEAVKKSVIYGIRYMMNKHLPDKSIDLIDEACARLSTLSAKLDTATDYTEIEAEIEAVKKTIEKAIADQDYFKAAELKQQEEQLKDKLRTVRQQHTLPKHLRPVVDVDHVGRVLADKLGIPLTQITDTEIHKLATLDTHLKTLVLGQDEAVDAVVKSIRRNRLSAYDHKKPIGSFLFLGASGVGKTYIAKLLAKEYFGDEKSLIRVDMSEYMEKYSVSKLIGSAPGYVGYDEGGMLTEQVRRKPYSVVLFDEIEKAAPDVLNVLLQILDEGHLKDNKGRWIDFKNTIIILTSNIGSEEFGKKQVSIGFSGQTDAKYSEKEFDLIKERVTSQVKKFLKPELINRLSGQIVFKPLSKPLLGQIFKTNLDEYYGHRRTKHPGLKLPRFTKKKIEKIVDEIYEPAHGARPIERYIHDEIEPKLIEMVLEGARK